MPKCAVANVDGGSVKNFEFLAYVISEWPLTKKDS